MREWYTNLGITTSSLLDCRNNLKLCDFGRSLLFSPESRIPDSWNSVLESRIVTRLRKQITCENGIQIQESQHLHFWIVEAIWNHVISDGMPSFRWPMVVCAQIYERHVYVACQIWFWRGRWLHPVLADAQNLELDLCEASLQSMPSTQNISEQMHHVPSSSTSKAVRTWRTRISRTN